MPSCASLPPPPLTGCLRRAPRPGSSPKPIACLYIERWFYPCHLQLHCRLADLYVSDPRFTERFERFAPQLAQYLRTAIYANAGYLSARERGDDS
ncbi:TipAS antibiotic-recognition domain-containing protein [Thermogemmatispora tikiterensis]|uniref:TipAS antibiotic-recognition domain-containing protein n=1 Tax=Thermogemmatispora tikiterensis TaxID=1825093 RepID=UPI0037DC0DE0